MNDAMQAETTMIAGARGDQIEAYFARPLDPQPRGGVVVIHHLPGYDAPTKEIVRTFAVNGYAAVCPNLYDRDAPGASPDDAAAFVRGQGGVPGYCSGGRQSVLSACDLPEGTLNAAVDCYGAFVLNQPPEGMPLKATPLRDKLPQLSCPLLGLFGGDDQYPAPAEVADLEKELTALGKTFEFHSYEGAGHGFFSASRPSYRVEAANDGWQKIFAFYGTYLGV